MGSRQNRSPCPWDSRPSLCSWHRATQPCLLQASTLLSAGWTAQRDPGHKACKNQGVFEEILTPTIFLHQAQPFRKCFVCGSMTKELVSSKKFSNAHRTGEAHAKLTCLLFARLVSPTPQKSACCLKYVG